jgi:ribose transport system substrate-binding protein
MRDTKSVLALIGSLLAASLAVTACGGGGGGPSGGAGASSAAGTPLAIAVVPKAVGFDYWTHVQDGAQCAASKLGNVSVEWNGVSAETDVSGQVNLINGYIDRGVNALIYAATDAQALVPVTQRAQQARIPVYNIDSGTTPQTVPLFATDNIKGAQQVAALMNQSLHGTGNVALLEFQPGSMTDNQRKDGFVNGLKQYPGLHLVADQADHSDANQALNVTNNILTANPDLNGIFGSNEPSVIGAAQAVSQRGLQGKVVMIGWDAAPDEVKALQSGEISALIVQNPFRMGFDSVVAAVQGLRGNVNVGNEDTGVYVVTKDNMNQTSYQAILNPSCQNAPLPPDDPWLKYVHMS